MNLRCPYCGDVLSPIMEYRGRQYLAENTFIGMECDRMYECGAEWDSLGNVTRESRWMK